ncbi:unnamed protein product [Linum tenue]|uniref:F-box domain-containing protein n=1 Tax=Linum tenue TaxID=586396 RepID=A0AAV0J1L9_9ROSI|nr:unnamed protein product [Linum tenue]
MATQIYHRKRKPITSTSSPFSKLDVDLLLEVLIRLPDPRSAVRCKPVCKLWNSLISAPYFAPRFLSHHPISAAGEPKPPSLTPPELRELILSFLPLPSHIESKFAVLDSAKDLLLLGFPQGKIGDQLHTTYLICNPFTKQWVALPLAPKESARCSSIVKLVSQPCSNPPAPDFVPDGEALFPCHFGYRRFRVVRMYKLWKLADTMPVEVFCSRSGRWTKLVLPVHEDLRCCIDHGRKRVLSLNDKLYWLNRRGRVAKLDPFCLDHTVRKFYFLL